MRSMYRPLALILLAGVLAAAAGCGSGVRFVRSHPTEFAPKDAHAEIQVLSAGTNRPHLVIGSLTAKKTMKATFDDKSTYDAVLKSLKDYARQVGADALIHTRPIPAEDGGQSTDVTVTAQAIRFMEQEASLRSAAGN